MKKTMQVVMTLFTVSVAAINYAATVTVKHPIIHHNISHSMPTALGKINLNTADATTIVNAAIKGIGIKRAQAVVAYRQQHGAFKSFNELAKVKGFGEKFVKSHLAKLSEVFTLA